MTPELAKSILDKPVNEDLLKIMTDVYKHYEPEDLARVIAHIRAKITLQSLDDQLDDAIAALMQQKERLK